MQALYQWQVSEQSLRVIERQFREGQDIRGADMEYFHELLHEAPARLDEVDSALSEVLDRPVEELDPVERAILRIAVYELLHRIDIPYRVILNEAIALAKTFGASESHRYVNGVLDQAARRLRAAEIGREPAR